MAKDKATYQTDYYQKNRADILEKKGQRYKADPLYAARVRKAALATKKRNGTQVHPGARHVDRRPVSIQLGETWGLAYSIGWFAERIDRSVATVRHWERHGLLPRTPVVGLNGLRYYSQEMADVVVRAMAAREVVRLKDVSFTDEVLSGWAALGVRT